MVSTRTAILVIAAAVLLSACDDGRLPERAFVGATMGTTFSVKVIDPPRDVDLPGIEEAINARLDQFNAVTSTYIDESDLSRFNASPSTDWIRISQELCDIVASALSLSTRTSGAFDITVGPLVNLWGFGPGGPVTRPPDDERIADVMSGIGYSHLSTDCTVPAMRKAKPSLYVDLSAYAKGLAVDEIAALLDDGGIDNYLVEIGGELFAKGINARGANWAIAIERPVVAGRAVQSIVHLTNAGLATSGDYRNFFEHAGQRYSHTIDPSTGRPVAHAAASVTVIAESSAYADAMATALLVMGPTEGREFAEREDIAALFLLRAGDSVEECMTDRFAAVVAP